MHRQTIGDSERGQASIVGIGLIGIAVLLGIVLTAVAQWYIMRSELQQAADIAAAHLAYTASDQPVEDARTAARRNGATTVTVLSDPDGARIVEVAGHAPPMARMFGLRDIHVRARVSDTAVLGADAAHIGVGNVHTGAYDGPLIRVDAAQICPAVGRQYLQMQQAAAISGVRVWAVSGYRSVAEQAVLYARLGPGIAAPPGRSLHHQATELDLAVGAAGSPVHRWLTTHAQQYGFIQRYSWEPWHWGNIRGC